MMRALFWKDYREQRAVGAVVLAVAALVLGAVRWVLAREGGQYEHQAQVLLSVAAAFAWAYGVVGGALLLAGEREGATQTFLDTLLASRRRLWGAKALTGLSLTAVQALALVGLSLYFLPVIKLAQVGAAIPLFFVAGWFGLAWGLICGPFGRTVIAAIGLGLGLQLVLAGAGSVFLSLLARILVVSLKTPGTEPALSDHFLDVVLPKLLALALTAAPLAESARVFTRPDRLRRRAVVSGAAGSGEPARALLWLAWRQARGFAAGLAVLALVAGLLVPLGGLSAWPVLSLALGALCGATAFEDEQQGAYRFLADQRLPLGRIWAVKVGARLAVALGVTALVLLFLVIITAAGYGPGAQARPEGDSLGARLFGSPLVGPLVQPWVYLTVWLAYGFAAGHLCGLLFRSSLVAGFAALLLAALLVGPWIPSMVFGGLHAWQVFGVPALLLAAGRLLLPAWAAGRTTSRRTALGVFGAAGLVAAWTAGGLWYRVAEVPSAPDTLDMPGFLASLPTPEENEGGRLTRQACLRVAELQGPPVKEQKLTRPRFPGDEDWASTTLSAEAATVARNGWPGGDPELAGWLDRMFAGEWVRLLAEAADKPTGLVFDPRRLTIYGPLPEAQPSRVMASLLAARGLQHQSRGKPEVYVEDLQLGLALSRNVQYRTVYVPTLTGFALTDMLSQGLEQWLGRLDGHPELLRHGLAALRDFEAQLPADTQDVRRAEYLVTLNTWERPSELLRWTPRQPSRDGSAPPLEASLLNLARDVPWEQARLRGLLRVLYEGDPGAREKALRAAPRLLATQVPSEHLFETVQQSARWQFCRVRAAELQLALRLFQAEQGKPAASLDELVPRYLPAIPVDPFDGQPFRYRLSQGERIEVPGAAVGAGQVSEKDVPPGQGILWSVGEDGHDDGGHRQSLRVRGQSGRDLIYLVPLPPKR
jgi:hypothetical protein